jgi:hypothetical protein
LQPSEKGVAGEGEVKFVNRIELGQGPDQLTSAFAVEMADAESGCKNREEFREGCVMEDRARNGGSSGLARYKQVDFSPGLGEQGVIQVEFSVSGDDASEWLAVLSRDRESHPVCFEGAPADEDGVCILPEFQQPGVIRGGGPAGWPWG